MIRVNASGRPDPRHFHRHDGHHLRDCVNRLMTYIQATKRHCCLPLQLNSAQRVARTETGSVDVVRDANVLPNHRRQMDTWFHYQIHSHHRLHLLRRNHLRLRSNSVDGTDTPDPLRAKATERARDTLIGRFMSCRTHA